LSNKLESELNPEDVLNGKIGNIIPKNFGDIIEILRTNPQMRREMVKWIKQEWGINIESYLEQFFGKDPDKKRKVEDLDIPVRELAENVYALIDEGWSVQQVSKEYRIWQTTVSRLLRKRKEYEKAARDDFINQLPKVHQRLIARLMLWWDGIGKRTTDRNWVDNEPMSEEEKQIHKPKTRKLFKEDED